MFDHPDGYDNRIAAIGRRQRSTNLENCAKGRVALGFNIVGCSMDKESLPQDIW